MRIAITGANGFVGRYLGQYLDRRGKHSIGLLRRAQADFPYAHRVIDYLSDATVLQRELRDCDGVVHLAGQAHMPVGDTASERARIIATNVDLTESVLRAAIDARVGKFIHVSSIKVYGEATHGHPFRHDSPQRPADLYAQCKHEAENRVRILSRDSATRATIIQPPLIYGHGVKGNLASLLRAMRSGIPLPFANIDNRRDIVALPVICDLINNCLDNPSADHQTFLVSDGKSRSTPEIIRLLGQIHQVRTRMFALPQPVTQALFRLPGLENAGTRLLGDLQVDITHTVEQLGWRPDACIADPGNLSSP